MGYSDSIIVVDSMGVHIANAYFVKDTDGSFNVMITCIGLSATLYATEMISELIFTEFLNKVNTLQ